MLIDDNHLSIEDNELSYYLKIWRKKQTKKNHALLSKIIKEFKSISSYSPHNTDLFNKYVKTKKIKPLLESLKSEKRRQYSPFQAKIQKKAHDIYVQRVKDAIPGNAFADWLLAEKEIKKETK